MRISGRIQKTLLEENLTLEAEFSEEEIYKAIKGSYSEGAPSSLSFLFY
jgi:hypothetical protein